MKNPFAKEKKNLKTKLRRLHRSMRRKKPWFQCLKNRPFFETQPFPGHTPLFLALLVSFTRLENQRIVFSLNAPVNETAAKKLDKPTGKVVGYARVSTNDQELDLQIDSLRDHGCCDDAIFVDKVSGVKSERPGLQQCMASLESGDILVVWRLDRLGRSMSHLVGLIEDLNSRNIGFRSICDGAIDTTTASGQLVFNIFAAMAAFERALIIERTNAGLEAARARGRIGGRPKLKATDSRVIMAKSLHADNSLSIPEICTAMKISKATLYRYLQVA